jgi:hypothetical protein
VKKAMKERRRHKRFVVDMLKISTEITFARHVNIYDISLGGICLKLDRRPDIGNGYEMGFEGKGRALSLKGVVRWSFLNESHTDIYGNVVPIYKTGLKFTGLSKDTMDEIAGFIEDHKKELQRQFDVSGIKSTRLHMRFAIESPERSVLNFSESCRIKKIGFGGMLIESLNALDSEVQMPMEIILAEGTSLRLTGRVASCIINTANYARIYDIGIEFLNMSDRNRGILNEFINRIESMGTHRAS